MAYPYSYDYEAEQKEKNYKPTRLATNRSMWKLMILNILTFGLYSILFFIPFSFDLDKIAPKRDHTKTFNYLFAYLLSMLTFSIFLLFWHHQISERVEEALSARGVSYDFGTGDFWVWYCLGSLFVVGPFVYFHKLCRAMNLLCRDYNEHPKAP